ncbi:hypothetical protein FOXG_12465 [Fusarium oxysporum f. sp. lycopersici 4287]|uniref:Mitochondrial division protein 1 n=1 Tax=Fusarium oxysporum f. sp. lycopersici (strain 4287 / CBS 123668 / FGSC 9935 / NRRL 34936) TaxID=426428 RepID=A0A0J9VSN0_FUSO4|nr:hypothetical protein FOXG_12465 [Fusarium oxysporum f. sp. lycopersici 4287]KNB13761.1 hypothetical protein FOXG_12465 [Fusarium oxysporum f. sp. lycopersici 4287]
MVFSKDGKLIASASPDKTAKIWNVATGEEERTLEGHMQSVSSVVFSKDGTLIASGSYDKTVKIWNVATGINVKSFDASRIANVFYFLENDSVFVTSAGRFSLGFLYSSTSYSSERELKLGSPEGQGEVDIRLGFGINHDNTWITAGGPDGRRVLICSCNWLRVRKSGRRISRGGMMTDSQATGHIRALQETTHKCHQ